MNTLLNGSLYEEEATSSHAGVTPGILPDAVNMQKGASVRYVPTPGNAWYVLRASYGREVKARDILLDMGVYAYVAQQYTLKQVAGQRKKVLVSLLPNLLFAYIPRNKAELIVKGLPPSRDNKGQGNDPAAGLSKEEETQIISLSALVSFYYNHFEKDEHDGEKNPPLTVKESEMVSFVLATSTKSEHLKVVDLEKARFLEENKDKLVEVIRGDYKGVRGRLARVAGQTCVVVPVANGKWNISTEYIPAAFMRPLE